MSDEHEYRFKIDAFTPDTLPMARLADYMADLASLLGEPDKVHFVRLEPGSAVLVQKIETVAVPKVRNRIKRVRAGDGPTAAMAAYQSVNKRLKDDNCIASLTEELGAEVLQFPGRDEIEPVTFGAVNQIGTLDGKLIVVGGRSDPVPVHLEQGDKVFICQASRAVAKSLSPYLFVSELRVHGNGRWQREPSGSWTMQRFTIQNFEILDEQTLSSAIEELRSVRGSGWADFTDTWEELGRIRGESSEIH